MEKNNNVKKGVIIGLIVCALVLLGVLGTYAYFIINVSGQNQNVTLSSGTLALVFEDGNPGINESLDFGSSIEKIFTIENTGTLDTWAKINFEDLINTYLEGSLTYSLSYKEDETEEYSDLITNENVPISKDASTKTLIDSLIIPTGQKYIYKLTITFNYLEVDQTNDLSAIFSTHFKLEQGSGIYKLYFMDGAEEISSKEVVESATYGELPLLEKNGFVFAGWFTEPNGQGTKITGDTIVNIKKSQTLYAHWKELFTQSLISKVNDASIKDYESGNKGEMYTFTHSATPQMPASTDYRYIGENPNNYIKFNEESWRIIGIFSVQNENNKWEQRIKIIRENSIGKLPWNEDECNDWSQGSLAKLLNTGAYFNRTGSYSSIGLTETAKKQIAPAKWYLGGTGYSQGTPAKDYYIMERSKDVKGGDWCGDRQISTIQNVGLIYPSDILYTYANGIDETCFNDARGCNYGEPNKGWIFKTAKISTNEYAELTITPTYINAKGNNSLYSSGSLDLDDTTFNRKTRPVVYLVPNVEISLGDGSSTNPYILKAID